MVTTQKSPPAEPSLADSDCLVLTLPSDWVMTDEAFEALLSLNEEFRFEVDEAGRLIIMGSGAWISSTRAVKIATQVQNWADAAGGGAVSGEMGYFRVGELGRRAPDVAWTSPERIPEMGAETKGPGEVVPDLIVEIRSPSDSLTQLQQKLDLWITARRPPRVADRSRSHDRPHLPPRPAARSPHQAPVPQWRRHRPRPHRRPHPHLATRVADRSVRVSVCAADHSVILTGYLTRQIKGE